jgi:hypothetical protein
MIEKQINNTHNITLGTSGGGSLLRFGGFATFATQAATTACASVFSLCLY